MVLCASKFSTVKAKRKKNPYRIIFWYVSLDCDNSGMSRMTEIAFFFGGAFESLISSQLMEKDKYIHHINFQTVHWKLQINLYLHSNFCAFGWCK